MEFYSNWGTYYLFHENLIQPFLKISHENSLKRLVKSVKLLSLSIKSVNPIQKYPIIAESYACTLKIFVSMFLIPVNFLISFGIC